MKHSRALRIVDEELNAPHFCAVQIVNGKVGDVVAVRRVREPRRVAFQGFCDRISAVGTDVPIVADELASSRAGTV